jgi:hypothetical protein
LKIPEEDKGKQRWAMQSCLGPQGHLECRGSVPWGWLSVTQSTPPHPAQADTPTDGKERPTALTQVDMGANAAPRTVNIHAQWLWLTHSTQKGTVCLTSLLAFISQSCNASRSLRY